MRRREVVSLDFFQKLIDFGVFEVEKMHVIIKNLWRELDKGAMIFEQLGNFLVVVRTR